MCLSSVYKKEIRPENLVLGNVQRIECRDGQVILTDLMERQVVIEGELISADLVGGTAVVCERV